MNTEQLLKVRYKVIADYPDSKFNEGDILVEQDEKAFNQFTLYRNGKGIGFWNYDFGKYPHLFKKLQWWEEREESDMPEYVKTDEAVYKNYGRGHTLVHLKVVDKEFACDMYLEDLLPATKEEYENQIQKVNQ